MKEQHGFIYSSDATYSVTSTEFNGTRYEHILYNSEISAEFDQFGIRSIQADPPSGTFILRRGESVYSKWLCFIRDGERKMTNFVRPSFPTADIKSYSFTFSPEKAVYRAEYDGLTVETTFFVPNKGKTVVSVVTLTSTADKVKKISVIPAVMPKPEPARSAPWDKPEWYMRTSCGKDTDTALFCTRCMSPSGDATARRILAVGMRGKGLCGREFLYENFAGDGDFFHPDLLDKNLSAYTETTDVRLQRKDNSASGYLPTYAAQFDIELDSTESKTFIQMLSFGASEEAVLNAVNEFSDSGSVSEAIDRRKAEFDKLFNVNRISTGDSMFDYFVNGYLPLQLEWVANFDRGWPTGMRGTRDVSNDCMGLLVYGDCERTRKQLLHLFSCQQHNGWFPRQCGENRLGPHDLRAYCDGGVYVMELLYEYIAHTKDFDILAENAEYSDGTTDSVFAHAVRTLRWYLSEENTGKYGLVKIYEGDWFDGVNRAGLQGKGVSVTASAQLIMALRYWFAITSALPQETAVRLQQADIIESEKMRSVATARIDTIKTAISQHAFNKSGYFNSVFNDDGKWIFSDNDPDGKARMYGPVNSFVIFSGAATAEQNKSAFDCYDRLKTENGYVMFDPPFTEPINKVGRVASGDVAVGMWGNGSIYNHGSQGFFCRACAAMGDAVKLHDMLQYVLPYNESIHPIERTRSAPYAIVNCYQNSETLTSRAGMAFLTGTTAYVTRIIYEWLFGLRPVIDGLCFAPCIDYDTAEVSYTYRGKRLTVVYERTKNNDLQVYADGALLSETYQDILTEKEFPLLRDKDVCDGMKITVMLPKR